MRCNMKCSYCYIHRENNNKYLMKNTDMPLKVIDTIYKKYLEIALENPKQYNALNIVWHGGEPLLRGVDFFKNAILLQKKYSTQCLPINNFLQTNGTIINNHWVKFFLENNFSIGVSLDGPRNIHLMYRKGLDKDFKKTLDGIRLLQREGVPVGILAVVTDETCKYADEVFDFFYNEVNIPLVDFIPCFFHNDKISPTPENWSAFLINIFNRWIKTKPPKINFTFITEVLSKTWAYLQGLAQKDIYLCELSGHCGRNLAILPNGDTFPCECLVNIPEICLGNIKKETLKNLLNSQKFERFKTYCNQISLECISCKIFDICRGGCFHRRLPAWTNTNNKDHYCKSRKIFISHIISVISKFQKLQHS